MVSTKTIPAISLADFLPGVAVMPLDLHRQLLERKVNLTTLGNQKVQSVWAAGPALRELMRIGLKLDTVDPETLHPSAQKKLKGEMQHVSAAVREYGSALASEAQKQMSADGWKKLSARLEEAEGTEAIVILQDTLAELQEQKSTPGK